MNSEISSSENWIHDAPPLTAIAAFEAIARLGSFAAAARELSRTPSAISHSIGELEKRFGVVLFERRGKRVSLTDMGTRFLGDVESVITALNRATATLQQPAKSGEIKISAPPLIVATVLIPNMSAFEHEHAPFKLVIQTTNSLVDLEDQDVDVAIRFADQHDGHLHYESLPPVWGSPIASPSYLEGCNIETPEDLLNATLIQVTQRPDSWARYFDAVRLERTDDQRVLEFDSTVSVLEAARQGLGVALGMFPLVNVYPGYGTELIRVTDTTIQYDDSYRVVTHSAVSDLAKVRVFTEWLRRVLQTMGKTYR